MTRDDIIRIMRNLLGPQSESWGVDHAKLDKFMPLFEAIAAAERTRMIADGWRQCAQGQKTSQFCGMVEQARAEEREACALAAEKQARWIGYNAHAEAIAAAIRARGTPDPRDAYLNRWARDRLARHGIPMPDEDDDYGNPSFG